MNTAVSDCRPGVWGESQGEIRGVIYIQAFSQRSDIMIIGTARELFQPIGMLHRNDVLYNEYLQHTIMNNIRQARFSG